MKAIITLLFVAFVLAACVDWDESWTQYIYPTSPIAHEEPKPAEVKLPSYLCELGAKEACD